MIKVRVTSVVSAEYLEEEVNKIIAEIESNNYIIIDIKFQTSVDAGIGSFYSAMIIYKSSGDPQTSI